MVKEVSAFVAEDGSYHPTHKLAARQDAYLQLMKLGKLNHASAMSMVEDAEKIVDALLPLTSYAFAQPEPEPR